MLGSQVQVLLLVWCSSLLQVQVRGAPYTDTLTQTPRAELTNDKDLTHWLLLRFLAELMATRGDEMLHALEEVVEREEEEVGAREAVRRRHLPPPHRQRKAGCRNFFWKSFTSC
ncbi:somatostatin-1 [Pholidichthys leucotaenia]